MPARSKQQYKFFKYLESNPEEAKKRGVEEKTIKDYTQDMSKQRWKSLKDKVMKKAKK